ncbi:murein biosynthesis integral membrane protein MurJ [Clostridium luticellarii]|jgi:putative peptidoglycan lipid II flippase|uniref:Probable lipid II flippase MurJ n=1 Tax=Clostridium luticellarii TaxID=1691940 RepID=A0A2T0BR08_9CLOT|nr:murein biosynthesis integral membrane protein MurJ [Clostridium luticellarii]MCI1944327.1 murein biosynthesis integral membrane protein MurJ [Clostridium luticellarii]MCI1967823.1 murein biosynthesis integral membrane protein MurJ [Clostridium luticellarii]MCI1994701.1 murein biosynthesis integral membrane protein MurJ [Clostridium luticellarii]MCI2038802.1 murein biosynthesis integral membrane protein MurJ [Clostridium luticellarii]PRR86285.1 putative peptidoglycan biosynthesis protein Mur
MKSDKLVKSAGVVMVISMVSRVMGFVRDVLIASAFGASVNSDAYTMSLTIPNIMFNLFGLAITTTFIPILSECYSKNGREEMFKFANYIMNILMIISLFLCVLGWIFTDDIVNVIANFTGERYNLTVFLTKISMINILFLSLNSGYTAILQTLDDFTAPALVGIVMNIPIILYILTGTHYGIIGLTMATMLGNGLQIVIQIPWLVKNRYKYSFKIDFKEPKIKKMLSLIAPVIIGTGVNQVNEVVQKRMAGGLAIGSIVALDYANKLNMLVYFTFASAIVTVIFPSLSRDGSVKNFDEFKYHISSAVNNINIIVIPAVIGLLVLRIPIISVLFMHGAFNRTAVDMTAEALFFLVSGLVFWGIRDVFNRSFYALQDTTTPMINGAIGVGVNIVMSIVLVKKMGIGGLTLATTISAFVSCVLLVKDLRNKVGSVNGFNMFVVGSKIMGAASVMGLCIFFIDDFLSNFMTGFKGQLIIIIICIIAAVGVYTLMLLILKVKELTNIIDIIKRKFKR